MNPCRQQVVERVIACPATQAKLESVRAMLEGKRIRKVEFTSGADAVVIVLHLDNRKQVSVSMAELSLNMLLRDPNVAKEEQERYYETHVYRPIRRRRKTKKGKASNAKETQCDTDSAETE